MTRFSMGTLLLYAVAVGAMPSSSRAQMPSPSAAQPVTAAGALAPQATAEETGRWFRGCWQTWNDDWRSLGACYDEAIVSEEPGSGSPPWRGRPAVLGHVELFKSVFPDARGELELVLTNGRRAAGIALVTGTHQGEMRQPGGVIPPTGKRLAIPVGHQLEIGDSGRSVNELIFLDHAALWGQLGLFPGSHRAAVSPSGREPVVVAAQGDERERQNLAAYSRRLELQNGRDRAALEAAMDERLVWSELALPADLDRAGALAHFQELWKGFSDLRWTLASSWAAGPYVVAVGVFAGTHDGELAPWGLPATGRALAMPYLEIARYEAGKLVESRLFYDGQGLLGQLTAAGR